MRLSFLALSHSLTVRTPNVGKAVFGAFASLGGGESATYIEMAEKARETAFIRLLEHAAAAGGNGMDLLSHPRLSLALVY